MYLTAATVYLPATKCAWQMLLYLTAAAVPGSFYRVGELAGIWSNIRDGEEQGNISRSGITSTNIKMPRCGESPHDRRNFKDSNPLMSSSLVILFGW
jgi:hypothetical protein